VSNIPKRKRDNIFTNIDHVIVRSAVRRLPGLLSEIMAMRFWQNNSVVEIAQELGVSVRTVDEAITNAIRILREECLRNPGFSRSLYIEIKRFDLNFAA
jgi:DNA-directed RNA polymerase specialized sigma24 family protein